MMKSIKTWILVVLASSLLVACGQGGVHENGRRTWGHSMVVNPWGEVENVLEEGEGVVLGQLDPAKIVDVRNSLPALTHRVL